MADSVFVGVVKAQWWFFPCYQWEEFWQNEWRSTLLRLDLPLLSVFSYWLASGVEAAAADLINEWGIDAGVIGHGVGLHVEPACVLVQQRELPAAPDSSISSSVVLDTVSSPSRALLGSHSHEAFSTSSVLRSTLRNVLTSSSFMPPPLLSLFLLHCLSLADLDFFSAFLSEM